MSDLIPVINLLEQHLGRLPVGDGYLDYIPMLADIKVYGNEPDDPTPNLKRDIAQGIATILDQHGMLQQPHTETPDKIVTITCGLCSGHLITINTSHPVSGKAVIETIAGLDPHCSTKHTKQTPDTIRARIQQQADQDV